MLALLYLVGCFFVFPTASTLDEKLVIAVRNGLEKNLHYIEKNYEKMNVDCILGVTIAAAVMQDAYEHGKHIMDKSSLNILNQTRDIVRKSKPLLKHNGVETWVINNVIDDSLWLKHISYKKKNLIPYSTNFTPKVLETIYLYENLQYLMLPSTDYCLHDVIKASKKQKRVNCFIKQSCWKTYFKSTFAVGYVLTHKLILLQVARNRGCLMPKKVYEIKIENLCSQILYEVLNEEHYGSMEDLFDLFLEQIVVCGYEGFRDFFKNRWLFLILKSQRESGCFPVRLEDNLKTRMKKNTNIFEDGCADHTTGLATAVLALYYNFIIKGNDTVAY